MPAKSAKATAKKPKPATKVAPAAASVDPARLRGLLDAVLAAPDDDQPRRVYADALSGAGDPRGDFIAVQCELAARGDKTEREDKSTKPLWDKFRELHSKHSAKWTKPLKAMGKPTRWEFHRGFVRTLSVSGWDDALTPARFAEVLGAEPVTDLRLVGDKGIVTKLLDVPGVERLRRLGLYSSGPWVGSVPAAAERLGNVRELRLGLQLGKAGIAALAASSALTAVTHLAFGLVKAPAAAFEALFASSLGQRLEILEICRDTVTAELAKRIVELPRLHTFVASTGWADDAEAILRDKLGDGFVIEDEDGDDYLLNGVAGVSKRTL